MDADTTRAVTIYPQGLQVVQSMAAYPTGAGQQNNNNEEKMRSLYEVGSWLGSGGFSEVHRGTRIRDRRPVAIKTVSKTSIPEWVDSDGDKLPLEVALLRAVRDVPNVLKLLEVYESEADIFLVLERPTNSQDLFDYITEHPRVSEDEGRAFFRQIVDIVADVLRCRIIHGDIKDENFIVDLDTMQLKLIDFGAGFFAGRPEAHSAFRGTREYAPPEWIMSQQLRALPATVWTLGVLLYTILNGREPFTSIKDIPQAEVHHVRTLSEAAQDLVARCMARDPDDRIAFDAISAHPWLHTDAIPQLTVETKNPSFLMLCN